MGTQLPPPEGHSPQFLAHICCGQMAGWIKMPRGMEIGLGQAILCYMGTQVSCPKKEAKPPPIFGPCSWCPNPNPNGWIYRDGTWHGGGPRYMPHCVRRGPSSPPKKGGGKSPAQFSAYFYCGQTAGCIKMPLGMEVGLGPGDFVFDGHPAPQEQVLSSS